MQCIRVFRCTANILIFFPVKSFPLCNSICLWLWQQQIGDDDDDNDDGDGDNDGIANVLTFQSSLLRKSVGDMKCSILKRLHNASGMVGALCH